jgi:hypothetical protein
VVAKIHKRKGAYSISLLAARPALPAAILAVVQYSFGLLVLQDLVDDHLILYAGNHLVFTTAFQTDRFKYALQALRPSHGLVLLCCCFGVLSSFHGRVRPLQKLAV